MRSVTTHTGSRGAASLNNAAASEFPTPAAGSILQRKCECGKQASGGECEECKKQKKLRRSTMGPAAPSIAPPIVHDVLRSQGRPLDAHSRALFEPRIGHDFSGVRVHTDARAAESARAVQAKAYTVGRNIVFAAGQYSPGSSAGRSLLAHELTHVTQQAGRGDPPIGSTLPISADGELESAAIAAESAWGHTNAKSSSTLVQGKPEDAAKQCGGAWTCGASACEAADPGSEGDHSAPTEWKLTVMIDAEAPSADEVTAATVGHTYVEFSDSTGAAFTYGFYPNRAYGTPEPFMHPEVFGCMVHPDKNHAGCVDYKEIFKLTQAEYQRSLSFAQLLCKAPPKYNLQNYNCTTFVKDVSQQASRSLPPVRGKVSSAGVTADNPYTLIENLRKRDVGPTYNLQSDGDLRDAISAASKADLSKTPVEEKIRVINRLLDGYFSEDDVEAIEKLCDSVATSAEMQKINKAVHRREGELANAVYAKRFHDAVSRNIGHTP
jgi:Domain of unknown function (DUF4157)